VTIFWGTEFFTVFSSGNMKGWSYNVKKAYPYSIIVRDKLEGCQCQLWKKLPDDKERKKYIKDIEKQVFKDYEE